MVRQLVELDMDPTVVGRDHREKSVTPKGSSLHVPDLGKLGHGRPECMQPRATIGTGVSDDGPESSLQTRGVLELNIVVEPFHTSKRVGAAATVHPVVLR
jgi:hypothetical protein